MSREIEFRFWCKEHSIFTSLTPDRDAWYGVSDGGKDNHHLIFRERPTKDISCDVRLKKVVLEQYTGLKDRNGVKIWEGDIIKWGIHVGVVQFLESGHWVFGEGERGLFPCNLTAEVIGNIHQNPELLA